MVRVFLRLLPALLFACASFGKASPAHAQKSVVIPVNSPAACFSPGNWAGDTGRGGRGFRRSWVNGAYCRWSWSTTSAAPTATILVTNPTSGSAVSYFIDGHFVDNVPVPASGGIPISSLAGSGSHTLIVYLRNSPQRDRWGGANAFTVSGLALDSEATPGVAPAGRFWALIVGDSITEGIQAANGADSNLDDYSFLIGQALRAEGWEYGLSACGYSGWLRPGDGTQDVPPYFAVSHGVNDPTHSRWDKIDSTTPLLDSHGRLSAYGGLSEEPSAILINYGTNETLSKSDIGDLQTSVTQCLRALRRAAPNAWICVFIPFGLENPQIYPQGQVYVHALKAAVAAYQSQQPADKNVSVIDLGTSVANALASAPYGGGVHPNSASHAFLASQLIPIILSHVRSRLTP